MSSKMDLVRFAILINNFISDIEGLNLSSFVKIII